MLQNKGCHGGFPQNAYQMVIDNSGLATEQQYPYKAKQGTCQVCMLAASLLCTVCKCRHAGDALLGLQLVIEALVWTGTKMLMKACSHVARPNSAQ